jgi:hypothetical protein
MRIRILGGADGLDRAKEAWRLSRDPEMEVTKEEMATLDLPVAEMPSVHLAFDDFTIIEREIFATPRNHVMWARTSHVDDPLEFKIPKMFDTPTTTLWTIEQRDKMRAEKAAGKSQDEWRFYLPAISLTSWTTRMSYRDLVKITKYFEYLTTLTSSDPAANTIRDAKMFWRLIEVGGTLRGILTEAFTHDGGLTNDVLAATKIVPFLHDGAVTATTIGRANRSHFLTIPLDVPLWMRAQIVRHRPLTFVDDFFVAVLTSPSVMTTTIGHPIRMELSTTDGYWRSVLSKRTCWLAQDALSTRRDFWQEIIDGFGFYEEMLPCHGGSCPYHRDAALRLTDADPGVPCPIYVDLHEPDAKAEFRPAMREAAKSRHEFWQKRIER